MYLIMGMHLEYIKNSAKNKITKTLLKINNKMSRHVSKECIQINTLNILKDA